MANPKRGDSLKIVQPGLGPRFAEKYGAHDPEAGTWQHIALLPEQNPPRPVALGEENRNVLNYRPERVYGFLYHNETVESGPPWLLRLEALDAEWFDRIWDFFREQFDGRALEAELEPVGESLIQSIYEKLPPVTKQRLYDIHLRYHMRTYITEDPAPVSTVEMLVGPSFIGKENLVEGYWYVFSLTPERTVLSYDQLRQPQKDGEVLVARLGLTPETDAAVETRTLRAIDRISKVDANLHRLLTSLYFPQANPEVSPESAKSDRSDRSPTPEDIASQFILEGVREHMKRTRPQGGGRPFKRRKVGPAPMVPPVIVLPLVMLPPPVMPMPMVIVPVPPANGMMQFPGNAQPFVGVNSVGSGNNIVLWDSNGDKLAYFDYGHPLNTNTNTYPAGVNYPCACGNPLMILSHWDYDHYSMVRFRPESIQRRWIMPSQVFGSAAGRELYVRILVAATNGLAVFHLWQAGAPAPGHVFTPFGFLERANGAPVNDDGLVLYVRVQDGAVIPPSGLPAYGGWVAPVGAPLAPGIVLRTPVIVPGGLAGEWIDPAIGPPFAGNEVVVPAGAVPPIGAGVVSFAAAPMGTAAGTVMPLSPGGVTGALWIPAAGAPTLAGVNYLVPGGAGGWAMPLADFVSLQHPVPYHHLPANINAPFAFGWVAIAPDATFPAPMPAALGTPGAFPRGGVNGRWLPAPAAGGAGGWAIPLNEFIDQGGLVLDFPSDATGPPHNGNMVVSPTPGTAWDPSGNLPAPAPPGAAPVLVVNGVIGPPPGAGWWPMWGQGLDVYELPVPPALQAALLPIPAGPLGLPVAAGLAAVAADECYILLPADAGFQHIPSQAAWSAWLTGVAPLVAPVAVPAGVPCIVGLVPAHHGASTWIPGGIGPAAVATSHIPARPGHAGIIHVAGLNASNKIAYSYGTRMAGPNAGQHPYGHPTGAAVAAYNAKGWGVPAAVPPVAAVPLAGVAAVPSIFHRINTAASDYTSAQPYDPLVVGAVALAVARGLGHLNMNVALGWDVAAATALTLLPGPGITPQVEAPLQGTCGVCAGVRDYYY